MLRSQLRLRNLRLASCLAVAHGLVWFCSGNTFGADGEIVRSVQYIETSGSITKGPHYVAKVIIVDGCTKRRSQKPRPKEGFLTKEPASPDASDFFEIYDARNGKRVYVYPEKREFVLVKGFRYCSGPGVYRVHPVKPDPSANLDDFLRRPISAEKAKELPERIVDGQRAIGFLVEHPNVPGTRTTTYWVDPMTRLPIRIEDRHQPIDPTEDGTELIRRNIIFDAPIDRSLFSTDPPAGYTVLPDADY